MRYALALVSLLLTTGCKSLSPGWGPAAPALQPKADVHLFDSAATAPAGGNNDDHKDEIAPGTSRKILLDERAGAFRRSFRLHVPGPLEADGPRPLVVALHGGFATGRILEQQTGLSELANRHGFFVVYPNGLGIFGLLRHWNGGYCCAKALATGLDDLGFVDRVIEWVRARYAIDHQRIYVVGYSNGGMLAYWYAAERAEKLAGLGIWGSSVGSLEGLSAPGLHPSPPSPCRCSSPTATPIAACPSRPPRTAALSGSSVPWARPRSGPTTTAAGTRPSPVARTKDPSSVEPGATRERAR